MSPTAAVAAFEAACNRGAGCLFITESWFAPFQVRLLRALPQALDDAAMEALRDALYKRRPLAVVVDFIERQPIAWEEFEVWCARRDREQHLQAAMRGFFPWADVEAAERDEQLQRTHRSHRESTGPSVLGLPGRTESDLSARARGCPSCGRPAADLEWVYFSSPAWTWKELCGRAGWLAICRECHLQVEFFLEAMN